MILVAGATGQLGFSVVSRLRAQGESVRALVRASSAPERIGQLQALGAELAMGDLREDASLRRACIGVRAVVSTVSMIGTARAGDSFEETDGVGTRALIDAAAAAGVAHFTFVSLDVDRMPDTPLGRAKREVEAHLMASGMTWTILRPGLFMESWLGPALFANPSAGTATIYGESAHKHRYVAIADVAQLAVLSLHAPAARNATLTFGGPDAITQREAVQLFEERFGRTFQVQAIPEAALHSQWESATDPFQRTFAGLMLAVARGYGGDMAPLPDELSRPMMSVRDYVQRLELPG